MQYAVLPQVTISSIPSLELEVQEEARESWEQDWDSMVPRHCQADQPCFLLYRLDERDSSSSFLWLLISWSPDQAPTRWNLHPKHPPIVTTFLLSVLLPVLPPILLPVRPQIILPFLTPVLHPILHPVLHPILHPVLHPILHPIPSSSPVFPQAEDVVRLHQGHLQEGVWPEPDPGGVLRQHCRGGICPAHLHGLTF